MNENCCIIIDVFFLLKHFLNTMDEVEQNNIEKSCLWKKTHQVILLYLLGILPVAGDYRGWIASFFSQRYMLLSNLIRVYIRINAAWLYIKGLSLKTNKTWKIQWYLWKCIMESLSRDLHKGNFLSPSPFLR